MQVRKTRTVDGEQRAQACTAAVSRRPIQAVTRQNQPGFRISSVRETVQIRKTRAIGADGEQRAQARTSAPIRRSIQGGARQYQTGVRESAVGVDPRSIARGNDIPETMQIRIAIARAVGVESVDRTTV